MMTLSEAHRMVVTMFDIQGMPHGEIATIRDPKRSLPEEHRQEF